MASGLGLIRQTLPTVEACQKAITFSLPLPIVSLASMQGRGEEMMARIRQCEALMCSVRGRKSPWVSQSSGVTAGPLESHYSDSSIILPGKGEKMHGDWCDV